MQYIAPTRIYADLTFPMRYAFTSVPRYISLVRIYPKIYGFLRISPAVYSYVYIAWAFIVTRFTVARFIQRANFDESAQNFENVAAIAAWAA